MKNSVIFRTEDFKEICSKILTAVDNADLSLITETLELKSNGNVFSVNVTNREYFVSVKMSMDESVDFHATVNAVLFLKLISQITTDTIEMSVSDNALIIKGNGIYKLNLIYDGDTLLELPDIEMNNITSEFSIESSILDSILQYNSKELTKGVISTPIQRLYYVDGNGAITFTSGACVNSFKLPKNIKILLTNKLVKLFKLFKDEPVKFYLGYDNIASDIVQAKVKFETDSVKITSILPNDDSLLNGIPVDAIRGRANNIYKYGISFNKQSLIQTINRLQLFETKDSISGSNGIFEFKKDKMIIYDAHKANYESIFYEKDIDMDEPGYVMTVDFNDLKSTLESCDGQWINMSFGDNSAIVVWSDNVQFVVPEIRMDY